MKQEGYKKLKIWQLSHELGIKVHKMSLSLPKFEMFEEGSKIRDSSKSVPAKTCPGKYLSSESMKHFTGSLSSECTTLMYCRAYEITTFTWALQRISS